MLALVAGVGLSNLAVAQTASATASTDEKKTDEKKKDDSVKMDQFVVTGSRIKRVDAETVSPVIQVKAADVQALGFPTLGDAIRALPFNNGQALTGTDAGTSFTPGVSSFNLRNLGNNNTLVLINGRRGIPYATPGFDGFQTVFDLNSLPEAAVDRIDILKDGGSALYGSDAVGGVVNVILKKDYTGMGTTLETGNYMRTDANYVKASVAMGVSSGKLSTFTSFNWQQQASVYSRDLPWSASADKTNLASRCDLHYEVTGLAGTGYTQASYLSTFNFKNPITDLYYPYYNYPYTAGGGYVNWLQLYSLSSRGFPGYVYVSGVGTRTFASPTSSPTTSTAVYGRNLYDFQQNTTLFPSTRRYQFYNMTRYDFSDKLYGFLDVSYSNSQSTTDAAPTPIDLGASEHDLTIPSYNAYNPWAVAITSGRRRLVEASARTSDVTSETPRVVTGLGGKLNASPNLSDWEWEGAVMYGKNTTTNQNAGTVTDTKMQQALNGLTRATDGSLYYNSSTATASRTYFNWFGYNDAAMVRFLTGDNPNIDSLKYWNYDIHASGTVANLPGGRVGVSFGAEHRAEDYANIRTADNATGNIIGGSEGTSSYGSRQVDAVFGEVDLPVIKQAEISLAARYEKYSDKDFAKKIRPKLGLKLHPVKWLVLRGSISQAFKAPDLSYLYTSQKTSFSSTSLYDPVAKTTISQLKVQTTGNPDLKPETTDIYYGGFVIEPTGKLSGLDISVDYFKYRQRDLLSRLSDYYGYDEFLLQAAAGNAEFTDKVVRNSDGTLAYIKDNYVNISSAKYRGYDLGIHYNWTNRSLGRFNVGADGTYVDRLEVEGTNYAGRSTVARFNAVFMAGWNRGVWGATLAEIYRGARNDRLAIDGYNTSAGTDTVYLAWTVKAQYTTNVTLTRDKLLWGTKLTIGINNLLNQSPPLDPFEASGTTPGINDAAPRQWYVRLERQF